MKLPSTPTLLVLGSVALVGVFALAHFAIEDLRGPWKQGHGRAYVGAHIAYADGQSFGVVVADRGAYFDVLPTSGPFGQPVTVATVSVSAEEAVPL